MGGSENFVKSEFENEYINIYCYDNKFLLRIYHLGFQSFFQHLSEEEGLSP